MNANVAERNAQAFTETPLFEALARAGYVARGVVYALDRRAGHPPRRRRRPHRSPTSRAQCSRSPHQPFGHALLVLTAIGLAGYALWRFAQAFVGHTPEYGEHSKLDRIGAVGSGIAYAAFSILAISVLRGTGGNSSAKTTADDRRRPAMARRPRARRSCGPALPGHRGLPGVSRAEQEVPDVLQDRPDVRGVLRAFTLIGVVGLVARAVAFGLIGLFVLKAARDYTPKDAVGIDGALQRLLQHSYGTAALIVVACGLIAFGAYSIADARYRKI